MNIYKYIYIYMYIYIYLHICIYILVRTNCWVKHSGYTLVYA